jgi:hypothetical protein
VTTQSWDQFFSENDTSNSDREEIAPGKYGVMVHEVEVTESKAGDPMLKVVLAVTDEGPFKNRWLWEYMVANPSNEKAFPMFIRKTAALGLDDGYYRSKFSNPAAIDLNVVAQDLHGRTASAVVKHEMYQGQKRAKIARLSADGTAPASAVAASAPPPPPPPPAAPAPPAAPQAAPAAPPAAAAAAAPPPPPAAAGQDVPQPPPAQVQF